MTGRGAMLAALSHAKQFPWRETDITDRWETWKETCRMKAVECDGHMFSCLQIFAQRCREEVPLPWPEAFFIIGKLWATTTEDRHAWVGYRKHSSDAEEWGDPSPGYPGGLRSPSQWARDPEWGYALNITDGVPMLPGFPYERM